MSDQPTDRPDTSTTDRPTLESVESAASRLGISKNAVIQRLKRGTLAGEKVGGVWWVAASDRPTEQTTDRQSGRSSSQPTDRPTATDNGAFQLAILRDTLLAPLIELTERQQAQLIEERGARARAETERDHAAADRDAAVAEREQLRRRVSELETKPPAAQVMGLLATKPAFQPIAPTGEAPDALRAERDALQARVRLLETQQAELLTQAPRDAPARPQRRWWRFWG